MGDDINQLRQILYEFIESTNEAAFQIDRLANELDQFITKSLGSVEKAGIIITFCGGVVELIDMFMSLLDKRIPSSVGTAGQFAKGLGTTITCSTDIIKTVKSMTTYHTVQAILDKCHRQLTAVSDELSKINVTVKLPERLQKFRIEYLTLCKGICSSAAFMILEGKQCMNHIKKMKRGIQTRQCNPGDGISEKEMETKEGRIKIHKDCTKESRKKTNGDMQMALISQEKSMTEIRSRETGPEKKEIHLKIENERTRSDKDNTPESRKVLVGDMHVTDISQESGQPSPGWRETLDKGKGSSTQDIGNPRLIKEPEVLNPKMLDSPEKGKLVPETDEKDKRTENRIMKGTEHDSYVSKEMGEKKDDKLYKRTNCELETIQSVSVGKESDDKKQTTCDFVKIFETGKCLFEIRKLFNGDNISHPHSLSALFRNISLDIRQTCPKRSDIDEAIMSLL